MSNTLKITLVCVVFAIASQAKSATFTVTDNLVDGTALPEGLTTSLFYVDSFLPDEPYSINSAYFEFVFSDQNDLEFSETIVYGGGGLRDIFYTDEEQESILLSIGSSEIFEETSFNSHSNFLRSYEYSCFIHPLLGTICDIGEELRRDEGYYEGIPDPVSGFLSAGDLLSLDQLGLVFWTLEVTGGLALESATLTVDYDLTDMSAVPVPAAVWLFGTALIGLVGFSRRRKLA